ncbi:hypothetical protein [Novosphingobium sp. BL-52-GroH]|uniref:hypothetical protein n=1 Tax=Novosphingobium sp. BL-52-GroH TaxID=3349877 RepID=UPI00384CC9B6
MIAAAAMLLLAQAPEAAATPARVAFDHAARCRVHTQMLPAVFTENPARQRWGRIVYDYWSKRSDLLAQDAGIKPEQREISYLLIPITADMDFINTCIDEAMKDGLKP